jgi:hypothetical protein
MLAAFLLSTASLAGCGRSDAPRVTIVNAAGVAIDSTIVSTQTRDWRGGAVATGDSISWRLDGLTGEKSLGFGVKQGDRVWSNGCYVEAHGGYRIRAVVLPPASTGFADSIAIETRVGGY